jgi:hypothetical protein
MKSHPILALYVGAKASTYQSMLRGFPRGMNAVMYLVVTNNRKRPAVVGLHLEDFGFVLRKERAKKAAAKSTKTAA